MPGTEFAGIIGYALGLFILFVIAKILGVSMEDLFKDE